MNSDLYAKITGVLFITATAAGLLSAIFLGSTLDEVDYLSKIASNENQIYLVAFFEMVMAFAVAGIAISMYPILKEKNAGVALGAVGFRVMEGVLFLVGTLFLLLLMVISKEYAGSGTNEAYYQTLGAFLYYVLFYQSKLIPRWLAIFGLIAVVFAFTSYISQFFGIDLADFEALFHLPMLVQEMVLAVWLIVKGYDMQ